MRSAGNEQGLAIWFTGLSSSGKTTLARRLHDRLRTDGHRVELLDGDEIRHNLCRDLGFSKADRDENIRRIAYVAELLTRNGVIVIVSAISPYRAARAQAREHIGNFVEVYVNAPLAVCERRDLKGLYRRARAGTLHGMTGVDDPYEAPLAPEIECHTDQETPHESIGIVLAGLVPWLGPTERSNGITNNREAQHYTWGSQCDGWHLVQRPRLSVIEEKMPPGTSEVKHHHVRSRQFFYLLEGDLIIEVEEQLHRLRPGDGIEIDPGKRHQVMNQSLEAVRMLVISQPSTSGDRIVDDTTRLRPQE
jgi:adenylylsulfate kinase